jgi:hypothetical protein
MGNSSSTTTQNITNTNITRFDLDLLNQVTNQAIANVVINNASKCSASSASIANIRTGDIVSSGPNSTIEWNTDITQVTEVTLTCIQQQLQESNIGAILAQSLSDSIARNVDNQALNKLVGTAEASLKQGTFGGFGNWGSGVDSNVNNNITNTNVSETQMKLTNVINNIVQSNTELNNLAECVTQNLQQADVEFGRVIATNGGKVKGGSNVKQMSNVIATCRQLTTQVGKVSQELVNKMGLKIDETIKSKSENDAKGETKSKMEQQGLNDLVESFGNLLTGIFGALFAPWIMGSAAIACIVICCLISCSLSVVAGMAGDDE